MRPSFWRSAAARPANINSEKRVGALRARRLARDNPGAFVVHIERNVWFCFTRCGGGDVIDLLARMDGVSLGAAARHLATLSVTTLSVTTLSVTTLSVTTLSVTTLSVTTLSVTTTSLTTITTDPPPLPGPPHQPAYVFRPFTRQLRLDPRCAWLQSKGIKPCTASRFEVGAWHGRGFLEGCVGARLHDPAGRPLGYTGRRCDLRQAARYGKWRLPAGLPKRRLLYNVHRLGPLQRQAVVVVEGPWDVLALAQLGVPAVGLLGVRLSMEQGGGGERIAK